MGKENAIEKREKVLKFAVLARILAMEYLHFKFFVIFCYTFKPFSPNVEIGNVVSGKTLEIPKVKFCAILILLPLFEIDLIF